MARAVNIYGGRDPRQIAMYTAAEAAVSLAIPKQTLSYWLRGRTYTLANGKTRDVPALVVPDEDGALSFENLVELHVLRSLWLARIRKLRRAVDYLRDALGVARPLLEIDIMHAGVQVIVDHKGELISPSESGQVNIRRVIESHVKRVIRDEDDVAQKVFPFLRTGEKRRLFEINPRVKFGRLCLAGTRIPVEVLWSRHRAGDSAEDLAEDYDQALNTIQRALAAAA